MKPHISFGDFSAAPAAVSLCSGTYIDESKLVKSEVFRASRDWLSSYIYSFLRLLEFESCWLISCQNTDFKILLGKKIGFDAVCLENLHARMFEKLCLQYSPTVSTAYVKNFYSHIHLRDEAAIAAFLYASSYDLYTHIDYYLSIIDENVDAPTYLTLKAILAGIETYLTQFKRWKDRDLKLCPLATTSESSEKVQYSEHDPIPSIPDFPGRPPSLQFDSKAIVNHKSYADLMSDADKLKRFSHYVYMDVEIAAMEVCAKNIAAYRHMPLDFKLDMARQIWDEARHAITMRNLLEELGGQEGDYTYSAKVWRKCEKGRDLAERLAIEQVFQEGNALESNFLLTESFKLADSPQMAIRMDFINSDEAIHVKIGNFWMNYLLGNNYEAYQSTMEKAAALMNVTLSSNVAVERSARKISGFPDEFVNLLVENNKVYGYRKS